MTATRRDRHQPTAIKLGIDVELLVTRIDPLRVRQHPHLNEVQVPIVPRIHFRVPNAGARAHALGQSWIDDTLVAFRILMLHFAAQHPGDDFHVLMRMGSESCAGFDDIVIAHQQQPVVRVSRIVVVREAKAVVRVKPVHFGMEPLAAASNDNAGFLYSVGRPIHRQAPSFDCSVFQLLCDQAIHRPATGPDDHQREADP